MFNLLFTTQISNAQWEECNNGLRDQDDKLLSIQAISFCNDRILAGTNEGVYISTNEGENWFQIGDLKSNVLVMKKNKNDIFSGTNDGLFISTDCGENWTLLLPDFIYQVTSIVINDDIIFCSLNSIGIVLSDNYGQNWIYSWFTHNQIRDLEFIGNNYIAATDQGIFILYDGNTEWTKTESNNHSIRSLLIDNGKIFAGTSNKGIFLSNDMGVSWQNIDSGIISDFVTAMKFYDDNLIISLYNGGVHLIKSIKNEWDFQNVGLNNLNILTLALNDNYIFAGTEQGIYRAKISDLITDVQTTKTENKSIQIFPNPTSNTLYIQFENSFLSDFSQIKIYSGLGNEIELPNPVVTGNNIQLDISSLPQGVYYVCVFNGGNVVRARFVRIMEN